MILWWLLKKLVNYKKELGVHADTKIRKPYIDFARNEMNVRLVAQTLSESFFTALLYSKDTVKVPEICDADTTAKFIKTINDVHDILNFKVRYERNK